MKSVSERFLCIQLVLIGIIQSVQAADPTFITPAADGSTSRSVDENAPKDRSILTVEGQDTDGDTLTFSIVSQIPISPPFELNTTSGLFKTPTGLNAEFSQQYIIRFGVSDGGPTVTSANFTVNINDVNEFTPVFSPVSYSKSISVALGSGSSVLTVTATDGDVTAIVTCSITAGNTNNLFVIDSSTGQMNTTSNTLIAGIYTLTVQASDGTNSATATVTITVDDYCDPDPCQNGTCSNNISDYNCTCDPGFYGKNCSEVDYCNQNPCQNNGTCTNTITSYTCTCTPEFTGTNCSKSISGSTTTVPITTLPSSSSSSSSSSGAIVTAAPTTEGQNSNSNGGSTCSLCWVIGVVLGGIFFIVIIICFLRYLEVISFHNVPFVGVPIEKCLKGSERRRTDSDVEVVQPINMTSPNPKVEKERNIELAKQPPNTDNKEDKTTDKPRNDSSEKYTINNDEKTSTDMSENDKTENGNLKDTLNNAEKKSIYVNVNEKGNVPGTKL